MKASKNVQRDGKSVVLPGPVRLTMLDFDDLPEEGQTTARAMLARNGRGLATKRVGDRLVIRNVAPVHDPEADSPLGPWSAYGPAAPKAVVKHRAKARGMSAGSCWCSRSHRLTAADHLKLGMPVRVPDSRLVTLAERLEGQSDETRRQILSMYNLPRDARRAA